MVLLDDENENVKTFTGEIVDVFDDGMRKIKILGFTHVDNSFFVLDGLLIFFVDEDTDFVDGGYLTVDEFFNLINNLN